MNIDCIDIKKNLESKYDIPFLVNYKMEYHDFIYIIVPKNELEELFEIKITVRQNIRLIIEVEPQKYAADMLKDLQCVKNEKKAIFLNYIELCKNNNAKVKILVNHQNRNMYEKDVWQEKWKDFKLRITKIISIELENKDIRHLVLKWIDIVVGMMLSLLHIEIYDNEEKGYLEGGVQKILVDRYERNPINRELCLETYGCSCQICGFDFEKMYGEIGRGFIHIHHIEKISYHKDKYYINPIKDLIPVCPNCHAMMHRVDPPLEPKKLSYIIKNRNLK